MTALTPEFLRLQAMELVIRRSISRGAASPFIAHVSVGEPDAQKISVGLARLARGLPHRITAAFERFPACATWLLASSLADRYGRGGDIAANAVWPHIGKIFGTAAVDRQHDRQAIAMAFRSAAGRFSLVLPSGGRGASLVDLFICQAGIAHAQIPALVRAFLRAEAVIGPPPRDDTQRLNMWEDRATQSFVFGLPRLQNIMAWDETAFHAGCFANVRSLSPDWSMPLAREMDAAIKDLEREGGWTAAAGVERPRFALVDGAPVVVAPSRQALDVSISGREWRIAAGRVLELPCPWPETVLARAELSDGKLDSYELPFLLAEASVALFDADSGVALDTLSPEHPSGTADARELGVVARCAFEIAGEPSQQIGRGAFIAFVPMGNAVEIAIAGRLYHVRPPNRPRLNLELSRIASGPGGGLFAHPGLLDVTFTGEAPQDAVLQLEHPALPERIVLPINGNQSLDLGALLPRCGPIAPMRMSVTLGEGGRVLVKASHWIWPGLSGLDGFAFDGPTPPNIDADRCEAIIWNSERPAMRADESTWRFASIAVRDRSGAFTIARPGLSVSIVDEAGRERSHELGTRIAILPSGGDRLVIRSSDPNAHLVVRGRKEPAAFGASGVRRLALASLTDAGPDDRIIYVPGLGAYAEQLIATVAPSTAPLSFEVKNEARSHTSHVRARFDVPIDAARLRLESLSGEVPLEFEVCLGRRPVDGKQNAAFSGESDRFNVSLRIDGRSFGPDCRVAELAVRIEGEERFRTLRNGRGDAFLFLVGGPVDCVGSAGFLATSKLLGRCVAPEAWDSCASIVPAWRAAGASLMAQGRPEVLLQAAGLPLPAGQAATWVPLRHPMEIEPELLSVSAVHFFAFGDEGDGVGELSILHRLGAIQRVRDAVGALEVCPSFLVGFANWREAERDENVRLQSFNFSQMLALLPLFGSDDRAPPLWRPQNGRLGRWHHDWCVDHFVERYALATAHVQANASRMLRFNRMINSVSRGRRIGAMPISESLIERCHLVEPLSHFLSVASHAWRNRTFLTFLEQLSAAADASRGQLLEDIGFLLRLAPELTSFYLLLWELARLSESQS